MSDPTPAATLVLFRATAAGPAEHLMIERASAMTFAGALVFPGGRVDAADRRLAADFPELDADEAAARIAAIRETIEETGVAPAITPEPPAATIMAWRAALAEEAAIGTLLAQGGYRLLLDRLVPFARWCPPPLFAARTYDTRFYIAETPARSTPLADGGESVHALWVSAVTALADTAAGRHQLVFPTRCNLARLAAQDGFAAAVAQARAHAIRTITPRVEIRDGERRLCIDEGLGYPLTSEPLALTRRS